MMGHYGMIFEKRNKHTEDSLVLQMVTTRLLFVVIRAPGQPESFFASSTSISLLSLSRFIL